VLSFAKRFFLRAQGNFAYARGNFTCANVNIACGNGNIVFGNGNFTFGKEILPVPVPFSFFFSNPSMKRRYHQLYETSAITVRDIVDNGSRHQR